MFAYGVAVMAVSTLSASLVYCDPPIFGRSSFEGNVFDRASSAPTFDPEAYLAQAKLYRLPGNVYPLSYKLNLVPNLSDGFDFTGDVTIRVAVAEATSYILLHSHKLDILSLKVSQDGRIFESSYTLIPVTQMLNVTTKEQLPSEQNFDVAIRFGGALNDEMVGFYRSSYEADGETKWIATTQFQPTYARMAFPCFDEPAYRAPFTISIARYEHQRVISNMPLEDTSFPVESLNNRVIDDFRTTPPMPTYLVAFIVSEFYFVADDYEECRVWARYESMGDTGFAIRNCPMLLDELKDYTDITYPLPKLDLTAIPDFSAGAMENWGLTTYREAYLLYNENVPSAVCEEAVMTTMTHELAHQWFGDYVTVAWWDYLWLNEGFATYLQYFILHADDKFVVEGTHYALSIDGIHVHRTMNARVNTPEEINALFDGITYHKAAAVLYMIQNFLGETYFRKAVQWYLSERHENGGTATPDNLYNCLELVRLWYGISMPSDSTIFLMMEQFADQIGYPLITVTRHTGTESVDIRIKQTPYRSPRSAKQIPDQTWTIPISCAKKSAYRMDNYQPELWSYNEEAILLENVVEENEWYICNVQQTGYYRVNYDRENWNLIKDQLKIAPEEIHRINRAQILDDSFTFAVDEKLPFSIVLNILSYLKWEKDVLPWYTGIRKLQNLYMQYEATPLAEDLKNFAKESITDFYDIEGFNKYATNSRDINEFRGTLTMVSCEIDISDCVSQALSLYYGTKHLSMISEDIKETVLCTAIKTNSTMATWNRLWTFYKETNMAVEKETVLLAVGCATNEELHKKYLFKLIDDQDVDIRSHNKNLVFKSMLRFYRGVTSTLKFIKEILPNLSKYKKARQILLSLLSNMRSVVKSKEHEHLLEESIRVAQKLDEQKYGDVVAALKLTKKAARGNIEENERRVPQLSFAIDSYYKRSRKSYSTDKKSSASSNLIPKIMVYTFLLLLYFVYLNYS